MAAHQIRRVYGDESTTVKADIRDRSRPAPRVPSDLAAVPRAPRRASPREQEAMRELVGRNLLIQAGDPRKTVAQRLSAAQAAVKQWEI